MIDIEKYLVQLKELQKSDDTEMAHCNADDILCDLLCELGYGNVVDEYNEIGKWYA